MTIAASKSKIWCYKGMSLEDDRNAFRELLYEKSFLERFLPPMLELFRIYKGGVHQGEKVLPDYCYNILAIYRRTYFKMLPTPDKVINVTDTALLAKCKSIDEAKQILTVNWRYVGRVVGFWIRGVRFFKLEFKKSVEDAGLSNLTPTETKEVCKILFGDRPWQLVKNLIKAQRIGIGTKRIRKCLTKLFNPDAGSSPSLAQWAYLWSPEAMPEFYAGMGEGMRGLLDVNDRLVGESPRANIYNFLLLVWPEIKEMLDGDPRKTITDLHEWMMPFMRLGVVNLVDLDYLRDVCASPSQAGIGLKLRPLSSRP